MRRLLRDNGLSIALFGLFLASLLGQVLMGRVEYNDDREQHGRAGVGYAEYLTSGHFEEAVFENWESEFLQMGAYVLLTAVLRQRGSAESKGLDGDDPVDADPTIATAGSVGAVAGSSGWSHPAALPIFARDSAVRPVRRCRSCCTRLAAPAPTAPRRSSMAGWPCPCSSIWGRPGSGSSRSRTGRASSFRSASSWCCRSSCASRDRRNPSRWPARTDKPGTAKSRPELRWHSACIHGTTLITSG